MLEFRAVVEDSIDEYLASLDAALHVGMGLAAQQIAALAQAGVRKDTGSLHDTIDAEPIASVPGITEWSVNAGNVEGGYKGGSESNSRKPGDPVDYAIEQEYGLGDVPSTSYMTPAAEAGWPIVQTQAELAIRNVSGG